jgi:hypothetical protein
MRAKEWMRKLRTQRYQPAAVYRDQQLVEEHREFSRLVAQGKYKPGDFNMYLLDRYRA